MSASAWRRNASWCDQDSVRTGRAGPSGPQSHPIRSDRAANAGIRLRSSALRPSHSPSGNCGSIQSIFLLPVRVAIGTPSRNAIRVEAVAETRSPRQTTPVRFSGSAALSVTIPPSAGARRTRRRAAARKAGAKFETIVEESFVALLPNRDDFNRARELLSRFDTGLRAGDALHLAIASNRRAVAIYSLDKVIPDYPRI